MESTNNNKVKSWDNGPIDIENFNSDAASFNRLPQAINDNICGFFFLKVLSKAFQPSKAFQLSIGMFLY